MCTLLSHNSKKRSMKKLITYIRVAHRLTSRLALICWLCGVFLTSCQQDSEVTKIDQSRNAETNSTVSVQGGRLFFASKKVYSETINRYLLNGSEGDRLSWVNQFNFSPLNNFSEKKFTGPEFYKYLLNKDGEVRVENLVIKIDGDIVYNVPIDRADLLMLLKKKPSSEKLDNYRFSSRSKIGTFVNAVDSVQNFSYNNGTLREAIDPNTFAGTNAGGTSFRYLITASLYCDGASIFFQVQNSLQYFWSGRGWYYASEYAHCKLSNINYSYTINNNTYSYTNAGRETNGTGGQGPRVLINLIAISNDCITPTIDFRVTMNAESSFSSAGITQAASLRYYYEDFTLRLEASGCENNPVVFDPSCNCYTYFDPSCQCTKYYDFNCGCYLPR